MDKCNNSPKICIIGAGFSGLCAGIKLRQELGIDSFTLFDENDDVGGTWLVNTYPGCACDVPSHLYSYSFEPNPYWTKSYAEQKEILEYLRGVAKKYELYPKIKFHHRVTKSRWDEKTGKCHITVKDVRRDREETVIFDLVISGIGGLRVPNYPQQFNSFEKAKMHSAEWNSSIELKDKTVAIIGSGASAVQIIPEIVDKVKRLIVYQRHPAWVVPKMQMPFPETAKWAFANIPGVAWALRNLIFWSNELSHSAFKVDTYMAKISHAFGHWQLNRQVKDAQLKEKLTPNYVFGCKRVTPSNDYYPSLCKPNVTIITSPISQVTKDTITNEDGSVEKPDVLILATGFKVQEFFAPLDIAARNGEDLLKAWKKNGPSAYAGIVCNSTPNTFFLLGPNTGLGHNSIIFTIECQMNWIVQVIREMLKQNAKTVIVKKSVEDEYMKEIYSNLKSTVWGTYNCGSWYADSRGVITTLWPESLISYWRTTRTPDMSVFDFGK